MKSYVAKPHEIVRKWYLVDASQEILGRMATRIARILMGKHRPTYTPYLDTGDFVVVVNAEKVNLTGGKERKKVYRHHTGFLGNLIETPYIAMRDNKPEEVVRLAVRRMLPKTSLGRHMFSKLKVYRGPGHKHEAQRPEPLAFGTRGPGGTRKVATEPVKEPKS
jgi:large subunit ribosomal protein L13